MLLKLALLLLVFALLAKVIRRRKRNGREVPTRTEIDRWADQELVRELTRRLQLPADAVRRAFNGDPEPEVVTAVEHAVRSVELCYGRQPAGDVEATLDVRFEDGETFTTARRFPTTALPVSVRDEYTRTGSARIYRPHLFTWSSGG